MKIKDVMSTSVHRVASGRSIRFASSRMEELRVGSLLVEDEGHLIGIVTSRDIRSSHPNRIVADAMTANPVTVETDCFVWDALETMEKHGIERLVVTTGDDQVIGIVTREVLKYTLAGFKDPLTGLYKAQYVEYVADDLLLRRIPFQLLFLDLNDFGAINKKWGHPAGDDLLVAFAGSLLAAGSASDYIARYAGDEFIVLTLRSKDETRKLAAAMSQTLYLRELSTAPTVGVLLAEETPDFFLLPYRELVRRASLESSHLKAGYAG